MPLDFRNTNSLWASVVAETLARLGLQTAILCPGSRSTPLTVAFAEHPAIEALPMLDERSAAFFALGCAKRQRHPVALVCTSGTAGANFYPAVIEAYESGVPLLLFTADRPPELRDCASGQTIDQQKLFGRFVAHYSELAIPAASLEMLAYLRQSLVHGWQLAQGGSQVPGAVHFNCPFRDPLAPIADPTAQGVREGLDEARFFAAVAESAKGIAPLEPKPLPLAIPPNISATLSRWQACGRGVVIAGPASPVDPHRYCQAVGELSHVLGWPVLAEGLSPLRNYAHLSAALISTYDVVLRQPARAIALRPDCVLQLGPLPTSKVLRQWLQTHQPERWILGNGRNLDPLHGPSHHWAMDVDTLLTALKQTALPTNPANSDNAYRQQWLKVEKSSRETLDLALAAEPALVESKVAWLLSQHLPADTPFLIANSMPVRDIEYFWQPGSRRIQPYFSRGANGIDGTLSTAMGLAHRNRSAVLLTGDLAFLHDTNGLLNARQLGGHLTVLLINNNGGGIFEMLPIAAFDTVFEPYFAMPQAVDLALLCRAYGVGYQAILAEKDLVAAIAVLPEQGIRILEVTCDRARSAQQRKQLLQLGMHPAQ